MPAAPAAFRSAAVWASLIRLIRPCPWRSAMAMARRAASAGALPVARTTSGMPRRMNLPRLLGHIVVTNEDCLHRPALDDAPLGQVAIAGEQHPALGRCLAHELRVADPRVIGRVVTERAQPAREPPDVAVGQEPGLHWCNHRIVAVGG